MATHRFSRAPQFASLVFSITIALSGFACGGDDGDGGIPDGGVAMDGGDPLTDAAPPPPIVEVADPVIPTPRGACPDFFVDPNIRENDGLTFNPDGGARNALVWMDDSSVGTGERRGLYFWFHGTGGNPGQAAGGNGYGQAFIDDVIADGGVVVSPRNVAGGQFPWYATAGNEEHDFLLMDEVVACAVAELGIDPRRIHLAGYSAGAIHTTYASMKRDNYLASVALYSGGLYNDSFPGIPAGPDNTLSALVIHGGPSDSYAGGFFETWSRMYMDALQLQDRLAVECNHGGGHQVFTALQPQVLRFFDDHPFGMSRSAYADEGVPGDFGDSGICSVYRFIAAAADPLVPLDAPPLRQSRRTYFDWAGVYEVKEYDMQGRITSRYFENDSGDRVAVTSWTFTENGHEEVRDDDGDGNPNRIIVREFDEHGNPTREDWDNGADGTFETISTRTYQYEYDNDGRVASFVREGHNNGVPMVASKTHYRRDDLGQVVVRYVGSATSGAISSMFHTANDTNGNVVKRYEYSTTYGPFIDTLTYNSHGGLVEDETYQPLLDARLTLTYTHDEYNQVLTETTFSDQTDLNNGTDTFENFYYE